ncbi:unnamed protein product [Paramecium octaurelia]|uniref:Uncharacterized protein n=1 Tax=Paramecium octaurelia TaxID=43137 RepID=A0A8S1TM72_PAROT|nr:unnamed protein product [Paramecium octaurelia]
MTQLYDDGRMQNRVQINWYFDEKEDLNKLYFMEFIIDKKFHQQRNIWTEINLSIFLCYDKLNKDQNNKNKGKVLIITSTQIKLEKLQNKLFVDKNSCQILISSYISRIVNLIKQCGKEITSKVKFCGRNPEKLNGKFQVSKNTINNTIKQDRRDSINEL